MPPPLFPQDKSHLKSLVICHYIMAGLSGAALIFILLHLALMSSIFMNPDLDWEPKGSELPKAIIPMIGFFYGVMILGSTALITMNVLSARYLAARKKRTFSMITAGLNCLGNIPGIALAVCTFIVLCRESVKAAYLQAGESEK